jgi:hypothetical protein
MTSLDRSSGFQEVEAPRFEWYIVIDVWKDPLPIQAWTVPESSRRLRLPDFKTIDI